jgi:hypothetical protein
LVASGALDGLLQSIERFSGDCMWLVLEVRYSYLSF